MGRSRTVLATVAVLVLLTGGCTSSATDEETAQEAADALAKGLTTGKLTGIPFDGRNGKQAQRWWTRAVAGMGTSIRNVSVSGLSESKDGDTATARIAYTWSLSGTGTKWTYDTTVALRRRADDRWAAKLAPAVLAPGLKQDERLGLTRKAAPRADILGAGGTKLVTERPVLRFGIDKANVHVSQQVDSARRLAVLLDVDAAAFASRVKAAGEKAFVEALVLRRSDVTAGQRRRLNEIAGAVALPDELPLAPTRDFARPILGTVGPVTAEIVKKSNGAYAAGDEAGLSGLQQRYDEQLRGTPGVLVNAVPAEGDPRELFSTEPMPGKPLRLTLDPALQTTAERLLQGVGPASAVVAVRPSDGEVLAAASGPGSQGYSTATLGQYAPGSTFKVVSSLALLRAGLTPDSTVPCTRTIVVDGKSFKNYDDYPASGLGRIPLSTAVANSCNTAFISQHADVSRQQVKDAAASLGVGVDHDLGFPVFLGSVAEEGTETEHAASLIGQGKVLASPIAMATVAASVGAGHTVVPTLVPDGVVDGAAPPEPLTAAEASKLRGLMRGVVTRGSGTFLSGIPGAPVLAKTGTAEFGDKNPPQTHAWMIAVQGDLAAAVFVDVGESGSRTAGPILEQFLRAAR
ncbi:MAG TPA: penicillin-binding transpeptidase domain-containing protein [Nocardioidaceae bacterium]|nr:penicillin-binding transpeptidase domain-containing protein [Nocardioidaceae bacterium]